MNENNKNPESHTKWSTAEYKECQVRFVFEREWSPQNNKRTFRFRKTPALEIIINFCFFKFDHRVNSSVRVGPLE
jgi:hypothetical protein